AGVRLAGRGSRGRSHGGLRGVGAAASPGSWGDAAARGGECFQLRDLLSRRRRRFGGAAAAPDRSPEGERGGDAGGGEAGRGGATARGGSECLGPRPRCA